MWCRRSRRLSLHGSREDDVLGVGIAATTVALQPPVTSLRDNHCYRGRQSGLERIPVAIAEFGHALARPTRCYRLRVELLEVKDRNHARVDCLQNLDGVSTQKLSPLVPLASAVDEERAHSLYRRQMRLRSPSIACPPLLERVRLGCWEVPLASLRHYVQLDEFASDVFVWPRGRAPAGGRPVSTRRSRLFSEVGASFSLGGTRERERGHDDGARRTLSPHARLAAGY